MPIKVVRVAPAGKPPGMEGHCTNVTRPGREGHSGCMGGGVVYELDYCYLEHLDRMDAMNLELAGDALETAVDDRTSGDLRRSGS